MDLLKEIAELSSQEFADSSTKNRLLDRLEEEVALERALGALEDLEALLLAHPWVAQVNLSWSGARPMNIAVGAFNPAVPTKRSEFGDPQFSEPQLVANAALASRLADGSLKSEDASEAFNVAAMHAAVALGLRGTGFSGRAADNFLTESKRIAHELGKALTWAALRRPEWSKGALDGTWVKPSGKSKRAIDIVGAIGFPELAPRLEARELGKVARAPQRTGRAPSL